MWRECGSRVIVEWSVWGEGGFRLLPLRRMLPRSRIRSLGSFDIGLLGRCDAMASHRPSVAPSAWSIVGRLEGCRPRRWHAGGLLLSRETLESTSYPWSARYDIVREVVLCRMVGGAQCQTPHVPPGRSVHEVGICFGLGCGPRPRWLMRIRTRHMQVGVVLVCPVTVSGGGGAMSWL